MARPRRYDDPIRLLSQARSSHRTVWLYSDFAIKLALLKQATECGLKVLMQCVCVCLLTTTSMLCAVRPGSVWLRFD
ncbi:uncharacterized protein EURHEDRAFT_408440 [Aspergillus ruber CBS 135680]|uniref:Uncharacterized protein n=1 Tax=Aspergillus ruber (strain CBS 135680) TaxID=1388766 RepID=A0A017SRG9_ASPRC|nr:uncharacterized protein EURHEDRAFT_408440 [Aspergillus ruber CBS 135680]EYE99179.1 hypothetical protein EURHEDRAFT_408440 [Aspergillus ruber CBS 135680]